MPLNRLVEKLPETCPMIHLDEMRQFVLHDVLLQVTGKEHEIETEIDPARRAAAAPSTMRLMDGKIGKTETSRLSHCLETSWKEDLGMKAKALLYHADEPSLNLRMLELLSSGIIADKGSLALTNSHTADSRFL